MKTTVRGGGHGEDGLLAAGRTGGFELRVVCVWSEMGRPTAGVLRRTLNLERGASVTARYVRGTLYSTRLAYYFVLYSP